MSGLNTFKKLVVLFSCTIVLTGCVEKKVLERISLTTLVGYDVADDNKLTAHAVIRQINPDLESKIEVQTATAATSKGTRAKNDRKISKRMGSGQLRVILFGEELAKVGLDDSIHILKMNSEISNATYLAVVEGDLTTLLEYEYENITDLGQHIYQLIQHNIYQESMISSTLHEINRDKYSFLGNYAMLSIKKEGENIEISGIAFFNSGKLVGNLPVEDAVYMLMMQGTTRNAMLELILPAANFNHSSKISPDGLPVAIDYIQSKRTITVTDPTVPEFNLSIKIECRLAEVDSNISIEQEAIIKKMEKEINKKIESEISRIIQYSQEIETDIFQFGEYYKAQNRHTVIGKAEWKEMYPEMKVNVTVKTRIIRDGVFQ